jgi:hypothetical protein
MKELTKQVREYQSKETEHEERSRIDRIKSMVAEKGLGDEESEVFSTIAQELFKSIPKQDLVAQEIESEVDELQEIYPGVKSIKKELTDTVKLYRKANPEFSVEDAYRLIKPDKSPRELKTEIEQRTAYQQQEPVVTGGVKSKSIKLTGEEHRTLINMQREHPDGGWTPEKIIKIMRR